MWFSITNSYHYAMVVVVVVVVIIMCAFISEIIVFFLTKTSDILIRNLTLKHYTLRNEKMEEWRNGELRINLSIF